jgi:ribosomal protein S21
VQPSEEEQLEQIREAVLYEQWQERRARRAARRERRNRMYDRDLSNLNEIFEGSRRRNDRPD